MIFSIEGGNKQFFYPLGAFRNGLRESQQPREARPPPLGFKDRGRVSAAWLAVWCRWAVSARPLVVSLSSALLSGGV